MKKSLLLLTFILTYNIVHSQIKIVSDINTGNEGSYPAEFFEFKGELHFSATITEPFNNNIEEIKKYWKTDGTISGTTEVENLPRSSFFYPSENFIFYFDGQKFVKTDGTTITPLTTDFSIAEYIVGAYGDYLYFTGEVENSTDNALYKTDGTTTTLLLSFPKAEDLEASDNKKNIYKFNYTKIIIYLETDTFGREPYITDGTPEGTMLLKNITLKDNDTASEKFHPINSLSVFKLGKKELWASDGTENGTIEIKEFTGSSFLSIDFLTLFNSKIYFGYNKELWETDGTEAGTKMVFNDANNDGRIVGITNRGTDLLILTQFGIHLFDGNSNTTTRLNTPNIKGIYAQNHYKKVGDKVFFNVDDSDNHTKLWVTDGTDNGTKPLTPFWPDDVVPETFLTINDKLIFSSGNYSGAYNMSELWVSDGTDAGTELLVDINKEGNMSSFPRFHTELNNKIYFAADDNINGRELFVSDGTTTTMLKDINPGILFGNPHDFYVLNNKIIFKADTENEGLELWITDGTASGTKILKDISQNGDGFQNDGRNNARLGNFTKYNNELYFFANDGTNGMELWKTNGTEAGTTMLKDINPGINSCLRPALDERPKLIVSNNLLYFYVAVSGTDNNLISYRMWKTDGTSDGTVLATPINDIVRNNDISENKSFSFNNHFYFYGRERATNKFELFRTDDTNGIVKIADMNVSFSVKFYPSNERIYYTYNDNLGAGNELWAIEKNDTHSLYKDIINGSHSSSPTISYTYNDYLYFKIQNASFKPELWRVSDTTEPEAILTQDNNDFIGSYQFTPYGNDLLITSLITENNVMTQKMRLFNTTNNTFTDDIYSLIIESDNSTNPFSIPGISTSYNAIANDIFYLYGEIENKGNELLSVNLGSVLNTNRNEVVQGLDNITVYPNPVINSLTIKSNLDFKQGFIYNILGRKILNFSSKKVAVSHLNSGVYIIKVQDSSGKTFSKKWIKK